MPGMITTRSLLPDALTAAWIESYPQAANSFWLKLRSFWTSLLVTLIGGGEARAESLQGVGLADHAGIARRLRIERRVEASHLRDGAAGRRVHRCVRSRVGPVGGPLDVGGGEAGQREQGPHTDGERER